IDMKKVSGGGVQHAKYMIVDGEDVFVGSQNFDWRSLKDIHELGVRARDTRIAGLFARVFTADWDVATPVCGAVGPPPLPARTAPGAVAPRVGGAVVPPPLPVRAAPLPALPIRLVQAPGDTAAVWPTFSPRGHIPDDGLWDLDAVARLLDGARSEAVVQTLTYG